MRFRSVLVFCIALAAGCALPIIGAHASGGSPAAHASNKPRAKQAREEHAKAARKPAPAPAKRKPAVAAKQPQRRQDPPHPPEPQHASSSNSRYALSTMRPTVPARRSPPGTCYARLDDAGIRYERVEKSEAQGVQYPTRLQGPIGGVEIVQHDQRAPKMQSILDCRLALAVLTWAPSLRRAGVRRIEHYDVPPGRAGRRLRRKERPQQRHGPGCSAFSPRRR